MFYVYILFSEKYNKYYIGHTSNVEKRLEEHNQPDKAKFTSKYIPWEIALAFRINKQRGDAMKVEKFIKNQKNRRFIEKLITNENNPQFFEKLIMDIIK